MRSHLKRIFALVTGGRPMRRLGPAFTDVVTGKPVYYFADDKNRVWLAETAWSRFRVPATVWGSSHV